MRCCSLLILQIFYRKMSVGTCLLCKKTKDLVKSHIIPRSFCLHAKGGSKNLVEARDYDSKHIHNWQNGMWDHNILCESCEGSFSSWDKYGFSVLGNRPGGNSLPKTASETDAFILKDVDYDRLKLFVLGVLWRASVTKLAFFSKISLGIHEADVADMIRMQNPGRYDQFAVVIGRLVAQRFPNVVIAPYRQRTPEGVNFSLLFLPCVKIMVKVDGRPLPSILEPVVLRRQPENLLVPMPLHAQDIQTICRGAEILRRWHPKSKETVT